MNRHIVVPAVALAGIVGAALYGCTPGQVNTAQSYQDQIAGACSVAMTFASAAGSIAPYIIAGCATEAAIAKLALDPSSLAWINKLVAQVKGR